MLFPRFLQILVDLTFPGLLLGDPCFFCSASYDGPLSLSRIEGSFFLIPPATKSCFINQNLYRGSWNERAGVTLPHHTSQITAHSPVLNILVLQGIFGHTVMGLCLTGPATPYCILASLHLAGSCFVLATSLGLLSELQILLTLLFRKCQRLIPPPPLPNSSPGQPLHQPRYLTEQKGHPVFFEQNPSSLEYGFGIK